MDIFTSLVDNYKESMEGLNAFAKIIITAVMIFAFIAIAAAVVNIFTGGL